MQPILINAVIDTANELTLEQAIKVLGLLGYAHHTFKVRGASDTRINLAVLNGREHRHPRQVVVSFQGGPRWCDSYIGPVSMFVADRLLRAIHNKGLNKVEQLIADVVHPDAIDDDYDNGEWDDMAAMELYAG